MVSSIAGVVSGILCLTDLSSIVMCLAGLGGVGLAEFPGTTPVTSTNYGALSPQLAMSFPQNAAAATLAGLQFQQLQQSGDARLQ